MGGKDSNGIEPNTESAFANKEGGIKKALTGVKRISRHQYEIMKQIQNTEPPKTTLCTAYGQLVAERLETLSDMNRIIVMNQIDNLFFRTKMGSLGSQYQSAFSG